MTFTEKFGPLSLFFGMRTIYHSLVYGDISPKLNMTFLVILGGYTPHATSSGL